MIFGKLLGAFIGYNWLHIPGAVIGLFIGHLFDSALSKNMTGARVGNQIQIQQAFFRMTFLTMGKLAKVDGQVSSDEIAWAELIMSRMNLSADMRTQAMALFSEGKGDHFNLDKELLGFRKIAGRHSSIINMFLEIQIQAAYADGSLNQSEHALLSHVCIQMGISNMRFKMIHQRIKAEYAFAGNTGYKQGNRGPHYTPATKLKQAYQVIGVAADASDVLLKKAYRRLMSQHHPDKLVAKGLPEEMMRIAKEKTQEIQAAYDLIKQQRKH